MVLPAKTKQLPSPDGDPGKSTFPVEGNESFSTNQIPWDSSNFSFSLPAEKESSTKHYPDSVFLRSPNCFQQNHPKTPPTSMCSIVGPKAPGGAGIFQSFP